MRITLFGRIAVLLALFCGALQGANPIFNSSFELGASGWARWGGQQDLGEPGLARDLILADGSHGNQCISVPNGATVHCRPIFLTNGTYAFSFDARDENPNSVLWFVRSADTFSTNAVLPGTGLFVPTTAWARYTNEVVITNSNWYLAGWNHVQAAVILRIDAVQIEPSPATAYAPMAEVEGGISTAQDLNTFFTPDTKQFAFSWWNDGGSTTTNHAWYEVRNLWNRVQKSGFISSVLPPGKTVTNVPLPAVNGLLRVTARATAQDELTMEVIPTTTNAPYSESFLGTHTSANTNSLYNLSKAGFGWARAGSPIILPFRWRHVEPTEGNFVWQDSMVDILCTNGLLVMAPFGDEDGACNPWATNAMGELNLTAFSNYFYQVSFHYKDRIDAVEIWNEPAQSGFAWIRVAENYAQCVEMATGALEAAGFTGLIIAMGGVGDEVWAQAVWDLLSTTAKGRIDVLSCHLYPSSLDLNEVDIGGSVFAKFPAWENLRNYTGKPVWNTEAGIWNRGAMLGPWSMGMNYRTEAVFADEMSRAEQHIRSRSIAEIILMNVVRTIGWGQTNYFYYDSRDWAFVSATTPYSWEITESKRANLVVLDMCRVFLGDYGAPRRFTNSTETTSLEMYYFPKGPSNIVVAFNNDKVLRQLTVTNSSFVVYDMMGNQVAQPNGKLNLTREPQYIVTTTLTDTQFEATLESATVVSGTDTKPPGLSIDIGPIGTWTGDQLFKWAAIDQEKHNSDLSDTYTTNVSYAYQIDGNPWTWPLNQTNFVRAAGNAVVRVVAVDSDGNASRVESWHVNKVPPTRPPPSRIGR